jgi:hypothetical protein
MKEAYELYANSGYNFEVNSLLCRQQSTEILTPLHHLLNNNKTHTHSSLLISKI